MYSLPLMHGSQPHRLNWVDSFRTRLPGCASHQVCSTYVSAPQVQHPVPVPAATYNSFHVAQLITSCPINLSVGQSCIYFISPSLFSNYPHQYPQSLNLGFHQYPLHDIKIKPNQLALHHLHITKLFYFLNQNTMFITDNKTLTSNLYI